MTRTKTSIGRRVVCDGLAGMLVAATFSGCSDLYAASRPASTPSAAMRVQNAGEPPAPPPSSSGAQSPTSVQATPQAAILRFAQRYSNWTYRTLAREQAVLAAMSVGAARLAEEQAAAATRADSTIARARLSNRGQVLAVAQDLARSGLWVIVTREQTVGSGEYAGLAASDHVTLAQVVPVSHGFAVSQWLPQS